MLSCKEIVKTLSSEDRSTWRKRLEVRVHLMMCQHCRKYAKHLEILKSGIKNLFSIKDKAADPNKITAIENEVIKKIGNGRP